jgi:catechol 2,3-dioxygenase-like lactoylglutathione lyase family enzyme
MPRMLDHIDLRVRNRAAAEAFYDPIFRVLRAVKSDSPEYTTWRIPPVDANDSSDSFGVTEDEQFIAGSTRIALRATSREIVDEIAALLPSVGALNVEMDDGIYGDDFYGVFFEDPDGNRLEVCLQ